MRARCGSFQKLDLSLRPTTALPFVVKARPHAVVVAEMSSQQLRGKTLSVEMSSQQPRRKTLSFGEKIDLINAVTNRKGKKKEVAARFGVRPSTLSTILKHKDRILTAVSSGTSGSRKKLRTSNYQDVEKALLRWVLDMRTRNVPLNGPMLQEKARDVASRLGCDDFKASAGWLMRFKNRHSSLAGLRRGEWLAVPDLNGGAVLEDVEDVLDAVREYRTRDVYAAQEMALFFGALPHETRDLKEDPCVGGSRSAQRLTVFLCSNMDGSDKRPPLVIGKSDRPKCFRGTKCIPVKYVPHPKAWMTPLLFCNWLCDFNASMAEQGRSVCLLVSRCTAHILGDLTLSNVRLCYVSADAHSLLPCPLVVGVINRLKCAYRQSLIERLLLNIRLDRDMNIDVYQALQMLVEAWKTVKPTTILSCFQSAGIDAKPDLSQLSREKEVENVAALPPGLTKSWNLLHMCGFVPENVNLGDYVYCDAFAAFMEEESGEIIVGGSHNDLFEDRENLDPVASKEPNSRDVLEAIDLLRAHAGSREDFDVAFEAIELYENCVKAVLWKQIQAAMKLEQGSIVSGVELLAEAALTATERLDTQVILLQDTEQIKTEEETVVTTQSLEPADAEEVVQVEQEEAYIEADEQPPQHEPPAEPETIEVVEQPHNEPEVVAHADMDHMEIDIEEPVVVLPVQPQTSAPLQQREASHSSAESGPVAVPLVPIQPADINYSDDSQSKSLPGLTGASTHHQPTGFDSSMFKMGAPLPETSQPQAVAQADAATPVPSYPSAAATVPVGVFSLSVTPSTSLGGVSSATGGEADDAGGCVGSSSVTSKVHKDKKKKKKKDKKHKHKHKHRSHDRLLEKERFYSSGGSTNQSPAPFGGGASSSPQHEII